MTTSLIILILVIITALAFDFTNGFHDTGNAMATSIATGALRPKVAVALSGILNLAGAFLSVEVALTVTNKVLKIQNSKGEFLPGLDSNKALLIVFAGLIGGIIWNLLTWLFGLPSSSSHALFGGLIGSGLAGIGISGIKWGGILTKIVIPAMLAPIIAGLVAAIGTFLVFYLTKSVSTEKLEKRFRIGQIATASIVSLAHGTGDAQKTMGVIALALIANNRLNSNEIEQNGLPFWIIASSAIAIALGTYVGGWRVIRTLGKGIVEISSPQGMAAESASAAIILTSSHLGMALSTTHVATGSILGSGVGKPGAQVRWQVIGRMAIAWLITLPAAAAVGGVCLLVAELFGNFYGAIVIFILLVAISSIIYLKSRKAPVNPNNVNEPWEKTENLTSSITSPANITHDNYVNDKSISV